MATEATQPNASSAAAPAPAADGSCSAVEDSGVSGGSGGVILSALESLLRGSEAESAGAYVSTSRARSDESYAQPRRRSRESTSKTCPACGQLNPIPLLSCTLCGVKFSVKHTAALLQQRSCERASAKYAELDCPDGDPALQEDVSADVCSESFKQLPLEAQIQVMQEKAAQRLLAQTLQQQLVAELHKNPALADDPEKQIEFRRLAQQQLLYQMALASHAAEPEESYVEALGVGEWGEARRKGGSSMRIADWDGSEYGDDDHEVPYRIEDVVFDDVGDDELLLDEQRVSPTCAHANEYDVHSDELVGSDGAALLTELGGGGAPSRRRRPKSDTTTGGPSRAFGPDGSRSDGKARKRKRGEATSARRLPKVACGGGSSGGGSGGGGGSVSSEGASGGAAGSCGAPSVEVDEEERGEESREEREAANREAANRDAAPSVGGGGRVGVRKLDADEGGDERRADGARASRRARYSAQAELQTSDIAVTAASQRLLKQLADFNPSGKDDSAPNVLLPNERTTRDRGSSWRHELRQMGGKTVSSIAPATANGELGHLYLGAGAVGGDVSGLDYAHLHAEGRDCNLGGWDSSQMEVLADDDVGSGAGEPSAAEPSAAEALTAAGAESEGPPRRCEDERATAVTLRRDISVSAAEALVGLSPLLRPHTGPPIDAGPLLSPAASCKDSHLISNEF